MYIAAEEPNTKWMNLAAYGVYIQHQFLSNSCLYTYCRVSTSVYEILIIHAPWCVIINSQSLWHTHIRYVLCMPIMACYRINKTDSPRGCNSITRRHTTSFIIIGIVIIITIKQKLVTQIWHFFTPKLPRFFSFLLILFKSQIYDIHTYSTVHQFVREH